MAASSGSPPQKPREPAWKRLGLKLKYAKDASELPSHQLAQTAITSETSTADSTTRQTTNDSPSPSKKRKTNGGPSIESEHSVANVVPRSLGTQPLLNDHGSGLSAQSTVDELNHKLPSTNEAQAEQEHTATEDLATDSIARPRRKSVTFSADTKQDDEGSASVQERSASQEDQSAQSINPPTEAEKSKKQKKREKKSNALSNRRNEGGASEHTPEYILYLQLFHTNRSSWKFNKNNQKGLLKNLFQIDHISAEYDEALLAYISGLKGATARQRVIEDATGVLKKIAEKDSEAFIDSNMESEEARRNAYNNALQRHLEKYERAKLHRDEYDDLQLEDMQREAQRGRRAEALLQQLLEEELHPKRTSVPLESSISSKTMSAETTSQNPSTTNTTPKSTPPSKTGSKRKRRKARTTDISDEPSSDSDSSESEGDFNPKRGPATVHDALRVRASPQISSSASQSIAPKKKIFDDEFLDQIFPKKKSYHESAQKRQASQYSKPRGFAYTHGTKADESGSEDE